MGNCCMSSSAPGKPELSISIEHSRYDTQTCDVLLKTQPKYPQKHIQVLGRRRPPCRRTAWSVPMTARRFSELSSSVSNDSNISFEEHIKIIRSRLAEMRNY